MLKYVKYRMEMSNFVDLSDQPGNIKPSFFRIDLHFVR